MKSSERVFTQSVVFNRLRKLTFSSLFRPLAFLLTLLFIAACSEDNIKIELTGQVDRSLPAGMAVCLDSSGNGKCDPDEPSARTNADGTYSVTIPAESLGRFPLVVEPVNKTHDAATAQNSVIHLTAPAGKHAFVSPISTAVQSRVYQGSSLPQAEADVRSSYSLPNDINLYSDYQGGSVPPETVQTFIEAVDDIGGDLAIEVLEQADTAENIAASRRVGVRRSSDVSNVAATDTVDGTAESSSANAVSPVTSSSSSSASVVTVEADNNDVGEIQTQPADEQVLVAFADEVVSTEAVPEKMVAQAASCTPIIEHTGNGNLPDYVKAGSG